MSEPINAKWIQTAHIKKGSFTRMAHKHGLASAAAFKEHVLAHPDQITTHTVRQANLMNTFQHMQTQLCAYCVEKPAKADCGGKCKKTVYCSQECANQHYEMHKVQCL